MIGSAPSRRLGGHAARLCVVIGAVCLFLGAVSFVLSRNLFDPVRFGRRAAASLSDPGVSAYAANLITTGVIRSRPDLIAFRPMLVSAAETVVGTKAFGAVVERAAMHVHAGVFSESSRDVLLSLPDLNILVHEALANASPAVAAKIPKSLDSTVARLANGKGAYVLLRLARAARRLRWAWPLFLAVGVGLYVLALCVAPDRQRAMARAGFALIVAGLLLAAIVAANPVAGVWFHDPKNLALVRGLWRTYLGDLNRWALLFGGLGILVASGASSLLERVDPFEQLARFWRRLATTPATRPRRILWGAALFACGCLIFSFPALMLSSAAVIFGVCVAYIGTRELFRVFLETLEARVPELRPERRGFGRPATALIGLVVTALGIAWLVWRNPAQASEPPAPVLACNGFPELCDRRVDQVVFPGAHNAMSNQDAAGWMFPHHEAGMPQMLRDGIRALLIDVHYGFAGGARIKTDLSTEPNAETMKRAMGAEGYAAAMRIRDRLVGVDESHRGPYFCHGFCELGAYPIVPALEEIRDFMVAHTDEVLIIVVEDYVTPQDLAAAFESAGFNGLVYTGNPSPQWPTLRQLIQSGQRVLLFTESGRPGVPWLRPAFQTFQETPYSFHKVEDFSCRPNRGGDAGSLFQINHWIDTTPTPKPSNAAIVNAYPFLLARAQQCAAERHHLPNLIAVDFYRTGDLFAVVNKLNGVATEDAKP
jgi:hypothetical protein